MKNEMQTDTLCIQNLAKIWGVIRWSIVRHKYLIPVFSVVQIAFAVAIMCGMAFMLPEIDGLSAVYLSSGALTLDIIAVGCVLAPQIVSESKQNGVFRYQKTFPVSRCIILLSDIIIWNLASLPGIVMGCIVAVLRFGVRLNISPFSCAIILFSQFAMSCVGFCIAYWFPPNAMALATQFIMIGGLLFSPIVYPAERLPEWTGYIYQVLPFVPMGNLIRAVLFSVEGFSFGNFLVVLFWAVMAFGLSLYALAKRE